MLTGYMTGTYFLGGGSCIFTVNLTSLREIFVVISGSSKNYSFEFFVHQHASSGENADNKSGLRYLSLEFLDFVI